MQTEYLVGAILIVGLLLILLLWYLPKASLKKLPRNVRSKSQIQHFETVKERIRLEDEFRRTIAQIMGGIVLLAGVGLTLSSYFLSVEKQNLDRESQATERFSTAIQHLGDQKLAVRIGGIYALGRIGRESIGDATTVRQVLYAYLSDNFALKEGDLAKLSTRQVEKVNADGNPTLQDNKPSEAQAIIDSLALLSNDERSFNFSNLNLEGRSFKRGNYPYSNFSKSNLIAANLFASNFTGARFIGSNLNGATTDIREWVEIGTAKVKLVQPPGVRAIFSDAIFEDASMLKTDLSESIMLGAKLRAVNAVDAKFRNVDLSKSIFEDSNLSSAKFEGTNLTRVIFHNTKLTGVNFEKCTISLTNFSGIDLAAVKGLSIDDMKRAIISKETKLPPELEKYRSYLLEVSVQNDKTFRELLISETFVDPKSLP